MPFDDFINLDDDLTLTDLERLDRQAEKTQKNLEKLKKKGGIFAGNTSNLTTGSKAPLNFEGTQKLSKQDRQIEKKISRLTKKVNKDTVKNFGNDKQGIANQIFGEDIGSNLFSIGKNPIGFLQNSLIGAVGAGFVLQIADAVLKEIQRLDKFFKIFVDKLDNRRDPLRDKLTQALIQAGQTQLIITTESGNVEARDSYNTFNEFNNNRAKIEEDFAIRNTSGYD